MREHRSLPRRAHPISASGLEPPILELLTPCEINPRRRRELCTWRRCQTQRHFCDSWRLRFQDSSAPAGLVTAAIEPSHPKICDILLLKGCVCPRTKLFGRMRRHTSIIQVPPPDCRVSVGNQCNTENVFHKTPDKLTKHKLAHSLCQGYLAHDPVRALRATSPRPDSSGYFDPRAASTRLYFFRVLW